MYFARLPWLLYGPQINTGVDFWSRCKTFPQPFSSSDSYDYRKIMSNLLWSYTLVYAGYCWKFRREVFFRHGVILRKWHFYFIAMFVVLLFCMLKSFDVNTILRKPRKHIHLYIVQFLEK